MSSTDIPYIEGSCEIECVPCERGTALVMRWYDGLRPRVLVYDGGRQSDGERLVSVVLDRFDTDFVDHVVYSHPDPDHAGGLAAVLAELDVGLLWMHRPWQHLPPAQARRLRAALPWAEKLEQIALRRRIHIREPFRGEKIGSLQVLSPCTRWYREVLLPKFGDPAGRVGPSGACAHDESSTILYGEFSGEGLLLCGDAGPLALGRAADHAQLHGLHLPSTLRLWQVPVSLGGAWPAPPLLDRVLGPTRLARTHMDRVALVGPALVGPTLAGPMPEGRMPPAGGEGAAGAASGQAWEALRDDSRPGAPHDVLTDTLHGIVEDPPAYDIADALADALTARGAQWLPYRRERVSLRLGVRELASLPATRF